MNTKMISWGFTRLSCESGIYYRKREQGIVITAIHVDDFLSIADSVTENENFIAQMEFTWTISKLGKPCYAVGIGIEWDYENRMVHLSQTALIDKIINQFGQSDATLLSVPMDLNQKLRRVNRKSHSLEDTDKLFKLPYHPLVGSLLYLCIGTRPDISYAVQQLSQFLDTFLFAHWAAAIRVVRYLKGTQNLKLQLGGLHPI